MLYTYKTIGNANVILYFDESPMRAKFGSTHNLSEGWQIRRNEYGRWEYTIHVRRRWSSDPDSDKIEKLYQQYLADKAKEDMLNESS